MNPPSSVNTLSAERAAMLGNGPVPQPTSDTRPFWEATARGELQMPHCSSCERYFFYPRALCRYCQSDEVSWKPVSGRGTLASYVINHLPASEFETREPQVIAIVELEEGVNLLSQLLVDDPDPAQLSLGMPLSVVFAPRGEIVLPFFVTADQNGASQDA